MAGSLFEKVVLIVRKQLDLLVSLELNTPVWACLEGSGASKLVTLGAGRICALWGL